MSASHQVAVRYMPEHLTLESPPCHAGIYFFARLMYIVMEGQPLAVALFAWKFNQAIRDNTKAHYCYILLLLQLPLLYCCY